jgi:hypothetical protein
MALRKNYSTQIENLDALKQIAAELGLVQTRGPQRGEGSIRRLLEAIAAGDIYVVSTRQTRSESAPIETVLEAMASAGIIEPGERDHVFQHVTPVELEGPPLSEQIVADRR